MDAPDRSEMYEQEEEPPIGPEETEIEIERLEYQTVNKLKIGECMEISYIQKLFDEAKSGYSKGFAEYLIGNYDNAVKWFEYVIPLYEKVLYGIDLKIENEVGRLEISK